MSCLAIPLKLKATGVQYDSPAIYFRIWHSVSINLTRLYLENLSEPSGAFLSRLSLMKSIWSYIKWCFSWSESWEKASRNFFDIRFDDIDVGNNSLLFAICSRIEKYSLALNGKFSFSWAYVYFLLKCLDDSLWSNWGLIGISSFGYVLYVLLILLIFIDNQ